MKYLAVAVLVALCTTSARAQSIPRFSDSDLAKVARYDQALALSLVAALKEADALEFTYATPEEKEDAIEHWESQAWAIGNRAERLVTIRPLPTYGFNENVDWAAAQFWVYSINARRAREGQVIGYIEKTFQTHEVYGRLKVLSAQADTILQNRGWAGFKRLCKWVILGNPSNSRSEKPSRENRVN